MTTHELFQTDINLIKTAEKSESWRFFGVASSEGVDEQGDNLLRSMIDTYYHNSLETEWPFHRRRVKDSIHPNHLEAVLEKNERRLFTFSEKSAIVF